LAKSGGAFVLTADANFGPNFGLISPYFVSSANGAASAGVLRLANSQFINFRNAGGNADIGLTLDSSNNFLFGSNINLNSNSLLNAVISAPTISGGTISNASIVNPTISGTAQINGHTNVAAGQTISIAGSSSGTATISASTNGGFLVTSGGLNATGVINAFNGINIPGSSSGTAALSASSNGGNLILSGGLNLNGTISSFGGFGINFVNGSATVSLLSLAAVSSYNFNLPSTAGTSGQVLTSGGGSSSPMTWTSASSFAVTSLTGDVTGTGPGATATSLVATTNSTLATLSALTSAPSLATVGSISTGSWNATPIAISRGGTGQTTANAGLNALSPLTTKGDLLGYNTVNARIPVGANGTVLTADSAQALGVKWASSLASPIAPTVQRFTSGTNQTYLTPSSPAPLYIKITAIGGGGAGGQSGAGGNNGNSGASTTFGSVISADGGSGGASGPNGAAGGAGGLISTNTTVKVVSQTGSDGASGFLATTTVSTAGGMGGAGIFGGAGGPSNNGAANSGAGGGGGFNNSTAIVTGGGGGAGAAVVGIITSPASSYLYSVGAGGTHGTGGSFNAGNGGSGLIVIEEYYQ